MSNTDNLSELEKRFIQLYKEGYRPPVILERIAKELNTTVHMIYKIINTKELKKIAEQ